jgi:hypothetical protein
MFYVNDVATNGPEDWRQVLKEPDKHWKPGYSAWALAHCWEAASGFPREIRDLLTPHFPDVELVKGLVEHRVGFRGSRGGASHNDLFVIAKVNSEELCIAVEGKVSEPFGRTINKWHTGTANREARLTSLCKLIGLDRSTLPEEIHYQLLHRLASPVREARERKAQHAIMIIHSFSENDTSFDDYAAFLALYGIVDALPDRLYHLRTVDGLKLYAGWARGDQRFRSEYEAGEK